jgi:translocation protein SEC63
MMQCITAGVSINARRGTGGGGKAGSSLAPLLALPHMDGEVVKKLRKRKVTSLKGEVRW